MYWNCNGIFHMNRFSQLQSFLADSSSLYYPDVFCLSECKISINDQFDLSHLYYKSILFPYTSSSSGLIFLYKSSIHVFHRVDLDLSASQLNSLSHPSMIKWLQIRFNNSDFLLGSIYKHPLSNVDDFDILLDNISKVIGLQIPFVLLGDWNSRHVAWEARCNNSVFGNRLYDFICNNNLLLLNSIFAFNCFTHSVGSIKSVLDIGLANANPYISSFDVGYDVPLLSDHLPIFVSLSLYNIFSNSVSYYNVKYANWVSYKAELDVNLHSFSIHHLQSISSSPQIFIDFLSSSISSSILNAADIYVGKRKVKNKVCGWYNDPSVKIIYKYLHRTHHLYQRHYHDNFYKSVYLEAVKSYKLIVQYAKNRYLQGKLDKLGDNKKNVVWKNWKSLSHKNKSNVLPLLNEFSTIKEGLNHLANHFSTISSHSAIDISSLSPSQSLDHLRISSHVHDFMSHTLFNYQNDDNIPIPFSYDDVKNNCINCSSKGVGIDGILLEFIVNGTDYLFHLIFELFCFCYKYSLYPSKWKIARILPLFKSGKKMDLDNYRPISITPILSRIFENVLLPFLSSFISPVLSPFQAGFRHEYCTLDNIYILQEMILDTYRKDSFLPVIFIDIKKAFDTVWVEGLLYKLYLNHVDMSLIKLLSSFLSNRYVYVAYMDTVSDFHSISFGVPQGCVLSPSCFVIYINSVAFCLPLDISRTFFADDIALFPKSIGLAGLSRLQVGLDALNNECTKWMFKISLAKTKVVVFSKNNIVLSDFRKLKLNNNYVEFVDSYKFLGLSLQSGGGYSVHENNMLQKLRTVNYFINRLCLPGLQISPVVIRNLLKLILIPSFSYAIALWRPSDGFISKCTSIILSSLRILLHLPFSICIDSLLQEFRIFPISYLRDWMLFLYIRRLLYKNVDFPARIVLFNSLNYRLGPGDSVSRAVVQRQRVPDRMAEINRYQSSCRPFQPFLYDLSCVKISDFITHFELDMFKRDKVKYLIFDSFIKSSYRSQPSSSLHSIVHSSNVTFDLPLYFIFLPFVSLVRLFRIRFDVANFNANIINRHKVGFDLSCIFCRNVSETRDHVLLFCPHYLRRRLRLLNQLHLMGINGVMTLSLLCGEFPFRVSDLGKDRYIVLYKKYIFCISNFIDYIYDERLNGGIL